jgi:hypothetical protein
MKTIKFLSLVLLAMVFFAACSKKSTNLELTVKDDAGNAAANADVYMYANESDWINETNLVGGATRKTNAGGVVLYEDVMPVTHYFDVISADGMLENNDTCISPVPEGETTKVTVTIN